MGGFKQLGLAEHYTNSVPTPADKCDFAPFTTQDQFNHVESNLVPGSNQGSCVQSYSNQFCIQGLQSTGVGGYTTEGYLNVEPEVSDNTGNEHFYGGDDETEYFNSVVGSNPTGSNLPVSNQPPVVCKDKLNQQDCGTTDCLWNESATPKCSDAPCDKRTTNDLCAKNQSCHWTPPGTCVKKQ